MPHPKLAQALVQHINSSTYAVGLVRMPQAPNLHPTHETTHVAEGIPLRVAAHCA